LPINKDDGKQGILWRSPAIAVEHEQNKRIFNPKQVARLYMDIKQRLKSMLQEAEIYRSQGLISEAHGKYKAAANFVNSIENLKNKKSLLNAISDKISALNATQKKVDKGPTSPELSKKAQDLIKNLFSFSENVDEDSAALEGAVALAKFGQFDRAINDLTELLPKENIRVEAAKNIMRCYLATNSTDEAVSIYHQWHSEDLFPPNQLELVRVYLNDALQKKGIEAPLPSLVGAEDAAAPSAEPSVQAAEESEEEFLDITSIGVTFESGPRKGKMVEFDVNFQSGNMLSLIISKQEKEMIEDLKAGMELKEIQFYSPIAIFSGAGVVASKTKIKSGPKQGDFCLDIRIKSG
jgi:tetratricopeptide (TPR) repeat protein